MQPTCVFAQKKKKKKKKKKGRRYYAHATFCAGGDGRV